MKATSQMRDGQAPCVSGQVPSRWPEQPAQIACTGPAPRRHRHALIGDGESPHLLKWARALAPWADLWVLSTRGFSPAWDAVVPVAQRLALGANLKHSGGNAALLRSLPTVGRWLAQVDADWLNPHYLTSSGTLVCLAKRGWRLRGKVLASAWGSDILVTPERSMPMRWLTQRVLYHADLCTSDSHHMTRKMQALGAREVMTFPFGLEAMPEHSDQPKQPWRVFANRGLEPIYRPHEVLKLFASLHAWQPEARLVVANEGGLRAELEAWVHAHGLAAAVDFVGRLDAAAQAAQYQAATWYVSLPESDSVAVSVLEAMAHGCVPILSDLPANRELVRDGENGALLPGGQQLSAAQWQGLLHKARDVGQINRAWVKDHDLFAPCVARLLSKLAALDAPS